MPQVFNDIWLKIAAVGAIILALLGALFKYGADKKAQGARTVTDEINKKSQKVQDDWDKIDRTNPTVDESLNRLRQRGRSE